MHVKSVAVMTKMSVELTPEGSVMLQSYSAAWPGARVEDALPHEPTMPFKLCQLKLAPPLTVPIPLLTTLQKMRSVNPWAMMLKP